MGLHNMPIIVEPYTWTMLGSYGLITTVNSIVRHYTSLIQWLAITNVALAVFNLVPGFPLDGGRIFRSLLWRVTGSYRRASLIAIRLGQSIGYLLILGGLLVVLLRPFELTWFDGIWLAFIGWFLAGAASASYRQMLMQEALIGSGNAEVRHSDRPAIPPDSGLN